jgi:nucleoside-diphosphate-sugar epimerase
MNRVVVVGGAGYVGCVLVEELLAKGYSVRVLDRLFYGRRPAQHLLDRIELVPDDMRDFDASHVEGCSAVINVGGLSNDPTAEFNPEANEELNTHASIRVARVAREAGVERMLFASSCSIYDRGVGDEQYDILCREDTEVAPRGAYASSKLAAEEGLLELAGDDFCVTCFRKGTIFGFSPRMRYDLVVNSFVKDALSQGALSVHYGGEMWRPLIDVRDVARAYVTALEADSEGINGEIFNLAAGNFRISELALRVQRALGDIGIDIRLDLDYSYRLARSYRVSVDKIAKVLGFESRVDIEESVQTMVREIERWGYTDFSNPRYYNIEWMKLLEETVGIVSSHGYVLAKPAQGASTQIAALGPTELRADRRVAADVR